MIKFAMKFCLTSEIDENALSHSEQDSIDHPDVFYFVEDELFPLSWILNKFLVVMNNKITNVYYMTLTQIKIPILKLKFSDSF